MNKKRSIRLNPKVGDYVNTSGRVIEVQKDYVVVQIGDADVRLSKAEVWNPDSQPEVQSAAIEKEAQRG